MKNNCMLHARYLPQKRVIRINRIGTDVDQNRCFWHSRKADATGSDGIVKRFCGEKKSSFVAERHIGKPRRFLQCFFFQAKPCFRKIILVIG